jgi:hypothetical protein
MCYPSAIFMKTGAVMLLGSKLTAVPEPVFPIVTVCECPPFCEVSPLHAPARDASKLNPSSPVD